MTEAERGKEELNLSRDDVAKMSPHELKRLLQDRNVDTKGCVEKDDLLALVSEKIPGMEGIESHHHKGDDYASKPDDETHVREEAHFYEDAKK